MSLNAMKCDCGSISVRYLLKAFFSSMIRYLSNFSEFTTKFTNVINTICLIGYVLHAPETNLRMFDPLSLRKV